MKYRKTALIEAEQYDGSSEMDSKYDVDDVVVDVIATPDGPYEITGRILPTMEGDLELNIGDWIATGVNGEHWVIADDVFKKTYAKLPVIPEYVAEFITFCKEHKKGIGYATCATFFQNFVLEKHATSEWKHIWITDKKNQETFARAWLDGYVVESNYSATPSIPK